mmetsp:Transcript_154252/g.269847  ORF Transcript_154252/g.269847 Transcript_154252/m.269847 type:complete len:120 (-) Transcript_154252:39-398(-)
MTRPLPSCAGVDTHPWPAALGPEAQPTKTTPNRQVTAPTDTSPLPPPPVARVGPSGAPPSHWGRPTVVPSPRISDQGRPLRGVPWANGQWMAAAGGSLDPVDRVLGPGAAPPPAVQHGL